ncbi:MAG: hypothetical protein LBL61_02505 [Elusimicrobiota bacterium]|jgi:hypothetical protein|nr:hypothetical protein [Elusimicrobiota bacterium]
MANEIKKPEVIEPEIFIPGSIPGSAQPFERRANAEQAAGGGAGKALRGLFAFALAAGTCMIFLTVLIVLAVPALIMALLGKKSNIKIFKYRL